MQGRTFGKYQITGKIKDGSVGTVWRAHDRNKKSFALKMISRENAGRPGKLRAFKKEATLTAKLAFPGIIKVYEYVPVKPQPFFVMEYFESENLKYAMWNLPDRVFKREFNILNQIAHALSQVHSAGVIHKDLKPENVLIGPDSEIRLIDFSLAQTQWDRRLQLRKRVEGTPLYMAPEQIRGRKCDSRTDVYAFGVLAFELLSKQPPFIATTETKVMEKHLKAPPPSLREKVPTASPTLDAFLKKLMAKKPDDRFNDMSAVMYELSKWLKRNTVVRMRQVEPGNVSEDS